MRALIVLCIAALTLVTAVQAYGPMGLALDTPQLAQAARSGHEAGQPRDPVVASNPSVLPPGSNPYGASYGEWTGRWWNWAMGQPLESNPIADPDGSSCGVGQSGPVWFLAGTFGASATRSCTVPAGKAIFFPIVNVYMNFPCGCPACAVPELPPSQIESCLATFAADYIDDVDDLEVEVDGVPLSDLFDYRAGSGLFTFTPDPSSVVFDGCILPSQPAVSDGYWIMLAPLSVGQHTIHFRGAGMIDLTDPNCTFGFPFEVDVTYNLTVEPRRHGRGQIAAEPEGNWGSIKSLYR